ncbi:MAG: peptidoglycan DD-metalloendopeptidase family protein [Myxococcales bacterium]|nr:peptidoglycan DD-metalloendopeptidase family protein [Myxococcales bacterium]
MAAIADVPDAADALGAFDSPALQAWRPRPRLGWPVRSVHITSSFGWRVDPVSGRGTRLHRGLDLRGAIGDLVLSIGDGRVEFVGHDPMLGTMVVIDHGDGLQSLYGHLSDVLVVTDAPVARGAAIGLVGNTGRSAAPHLHLTVKLDGHAIDPLEVIGEPLYRPMALATPADAPVGSLPPSPLDPLDRAGAPSDPDPTGGVSSANTPPPGAQLGLPLGTPSMRHPLPQRSDDGGEP